MTYRLRVFLDSNVLFSAAYVSPNSFEAFWTFPDTDILTSQYAIGEVSRHLKTPEQRARVWRLISISHLVPEGELPGSIAIELPPKDLPILLAAAAARADILVTGDFRHFGTYFGKKLLGVAIESPAMFKTRYPENLHREPQPE